MAVQPYYERNTRPEPVPITDAAEHTLHVAERLLRDWLELARLEATERIRAGALSAAFFVGAAFLAILAWIGLSVALGLLLVRWLPGDASAAIVAGAHAVLAGALILSARRRAAAATEGS
jgi:hypothetical protein